MRGGIASVKFLRGRAREARVFVWAFDPVGLDGEDLRDLPLERPKREGSHSVHRLAVPGG